MRTFSTDILLEKAGGEERLSAVEHKAKELLARNILKGIAEGGAQADVAMDDATATTLLDALHLIELRCIDLSEAWRRDPRSVAGIEFRNRCSLAFEIRRVLPLAATVHERVKGTLRLAAVGILGDRSSDVRRHLSETAWPVPAANGQDSDWPQKVLYGVAKAFLHVVRKQGWGDLRAVADAIATLRASQEKYELEYLQRENGIRQVAALELVAFYQLAKAVELLGEFVGKGTPPTALDDVDFHLSRAVDAADSAGIIELAMLLRWISMAARVQIRSTIWHQLLAYNSKLSKFKEWLASEEQAQPLFELLPPQRDAMREVMNVGNRAVVVEMPTSSGKTMLAEFRIIQTKVNVNKAWIAYLVPTRALVNQVAVRLRRDLGPLGLAIEQATPAFELDAYEKELVSEPENFDVLVTTPEKLDLLFRSGVVTSGEGVLGLVILDEAHNICDGERGLRSELVLATINRESPETHFLLLTPFVPNANELASWLDEERSSSVKPSLAVNWQPNDRLVGMAYPQGKGKYWGLDLKPLHVKQGHGAPIYFDDVVALEHAHAQDTTMSNAKTSKLNVAALVAKSLAARGSSIALAYSPTDCWNLAAKLAGMLPDKRSNKLSLVRDFVKAEYGENFALHGYLGKGVGVHHAGISPEVRTLLEWLAEEGELVSLVATTTVAQGVNFPISSVILSSHHKPHRVGPYTAKTMLRPDEFWNIAGRAGRLFQDTLGLVIFASQQTTDASLEAYVNDSVAELTSVLEQMIEDTIERGWELDLRRLVLNDAKWSNFVQYLAHCYRTIGDHEQFLSDTEKLLKRTYAYHRLSEHNPEKAAMLIDSTRRYAEQLKGLQKGVLSLVDSTGFSPESVASLLREKEAFKLKPADWSPSRLFRSGSEGAASLVGALLKIPELKMLPSGGGEGTSIASMLQMWVSGKALGEIADKHFAEIVDTQKRLTECCRTLHQTLSHQACWGFSALQSMSELAEADLPVEKMAEIYAVPSMIYYGVPTMEAILMRNHGVPRSVSVELGKKFASEDNKADAKAKLIKARRWLEQSSTETWQDAAQRAGLSIDGVRMHQAWCVITGQNDKAVGLA